jgi:hypothetical protein
VDKLGNIVVIKLEVLVWKQMFDVFQITGNKVIHADDMIALFDESVAQMRTKKSGSTGDKYSFHTN